MQGEWRAEIVKNYRVPLGLFDQPLANGGINKFFYHHSIKRQGCAANAGSYHTEVHGINVVGYRRGVRAVSLASETYKTYGLYLRKMSGGRTLKQIWYFRNAVGSKDGVRTQ